MRSRQRTFRYQPQSFVEHNTPAGIWRIPLRSRRARQVARWFGLDAIIKPSSRETPVSPAPQPTLSPGTITLVTGASGAGKSSLLRATREAILALPPTWQRDWIDLADITLPHRPLTNCFESSMPLRDVLKLLSRVGLGEAWTYLRTPAELSDGQRWRLKLAMGLHRASASRASAPILVADEFCGLLDRVTACVVARCLRKSLDAMPTVAALLATSHDDLALPLEPDVSVHCDFGRTIVRYNARRNRASSGKGATS